MFGPWRTSRGHGLDIIFFGMEKQKTAIFISIVMSYLVTCLCNGGAFFFVFSLAAVPLSALGCFCGTLIILSYCHDGGKGNWEEFISFKDPKVANSYKDVKVPIDLVVEEYLRGNIEMKKDLYEVFLFRNEIFRFTFTWNHCKFYFGTFLGQNVTHSESADFSEVSEVYNRGNDFYNWFLGPSMIYTSGIFHSEDESLEAGQKRKMDLVCQQVHMKKGDKHLDIGCGWGTLLAHSAKHFGSKCMGVTLAKEQAAWGRETCKKYGVENEVDIHVLDYRKIPSEMVFDKITCLEMAEHVGIKNFQNFLCQVNGMLADDGIFYLQIAGLRRQWQYEDLVWGMFMGKYIFPAADASCPLAFVVGHLERAGFEVHRVENTGVHYSLTIKKWYDNWMSNKEKVLKKYGQFWFRLWEVFLAWSAIIAAQGSSTVFMVTCHKNHKNDPVSVSDGKSKAPFNRMSHWVGPNPIAVQQ